MPKATKKISQPNRRRAPAITMEAREDQMVALAVDLAERQLLDGTASSQVITHFLKQGSMRDQLEREKLRQENELLKAKTEAIQSAKDVEVLYKQVLEAVALYSGNVKETRDD